ncbi:MAG: phenylacetate-CoA oxygenase subunit PaaC [Nitrococcus sp.]|nr:phenylacetate-CoA oxygenase subunit PaaC [Nitrococcus sp.]
MNRQQALFEYLLRLGDNALILGQRLTEWIGHAPALEEELGSANIALDLIGQARGWLAYAGTVEGAGRDEDALAFQRDVLDFRNVLLVEQPNGDYGDTIARQYLFDAFHYPLLTALSACADQSIAALAAKASKEAGYHRRRSAEWVIRLGDGTVESHAKLQQSIDTLWPYTGELFALDEVDHTLRRLGVAADLSAVRREWDEHITRTLAVATLEPPQEGWMQSGGKQGRHSEQLGYLLAEMQFLPRAYPDARW